MKKTILKMHFTRLLFGLLFKGWAESNEEKAVEFLKNYDVKFKPLWRDEYEAKWKMATNISKYNSRVQNNILNGIRKKEAKWRHLASKINLTNVSEDIKRQFRIFLTVSTFRDKGSLKRTHEMRNIMRTMYNNARVSFNPRLVETLPEGSNRRLIDLELGKHLKYIMAKSTDSDELLYVWKSWRDITGPYMKTYFTEYVKLRNVGARASGYEDTGHVRRAQYEVEDLDGIAETFLKDLHPFYLELHGYVRHRLSKLYPHEVKDGKSLPAHLLGNMWAQNWENIYKHIVPYPDEPTLDVTPAIKKLSIKKMFKMAEEFYTSLGWQKLPKKFWTHSMFKRPRRRRVDCQASAWDFTMDSNGEPDVRVKMCTRKTQADFKTIHHELGHTYYQLFYWNQPLVYRTGANPGFHEAIGDTIVLSVQTPAHLKKIGLLKEVSNSPESDINFLLKTALRHIVFLPYAYVMDKWMWHVYSGDIKPNEYNKVWWEYREFYHGIKSPVRREPGGFDPGSKAHIIFDAPYIRYFFSYILQFTFHHTSCQKAKHEGPLHRCSIYQSKEAGKAFGDMLKLGRSKPWPQVLKQFTGTPNISTDPIKEYFKPLIVWLRKQRMEKKYKIGW